jgi:hypothetical protein
MTPTPAKLYTATVTIQYVEESRTRGTWQRPDGIRRFVIGAEKTTGESLGERRIGLTTLDPWRASLCLQAKDKGFKLFIKYKLTRWFDADLLHCEVVKDEVPV